MSRWAESYPIDYSAQVQRALFGASHDFFIRGKAAWLEHFLAMRSISPTATLDIGCGIGLLHRYLNPWAGDVSGCDVSDIALVEAAQRNDTASYRLYDGRDLPFPAGSFDVALAVTVLHHVPPADWQHFVNEAARVLRPGGVLVVIEHNPFNPLTRLSVARSELDHDAVLLSSKQTMRLMCNAGLRDVGCDYIFFTPIEATQRIDRVLRWLPIGAQYAAYGFKTLKDLSNLEHASHHATEQRSARTSIDKHCAAVSTVAQRIGAR